MTDYLTIANIIDGYRSKSFTANDVFSHYYDRIEKYDQASTRLNSFITLLPRENLLSGLNATNQSIPIAHKDIYSTDGIQTTAASNILRGYIPPYDATSVKRLRESNFKVIGKLNCDAFAHGSTGEYSDMGPTRNPYDTDYVAGGSSSGSAAAVAAGLTPAATATDTGGSIRVPASFTNTVGIKPTYGRVSRYGVIAMTSSTDSIGHITRTVWDNAYVLTKTAGYDPLDATTAKTPPPSDYLVEIDTGIKGLKLGIPKEFIVNIDPAIEKIFEQSVKTLEKLGASIHEVSLPNTEYGIYTYYILTPSEVSSNLARFDGIRFGHDRSQFGAEAKRRIMIGTYCLSSGYYDDYYKKAQQVRTLIVRDFKQALGQVDALIGPITPRLQPEIGELVNDPIANYMMDALMVPVNLAGVPALAVPAGFVGNLPVGIQVIGNHFEEKLLYQIGYAFEQETEFYKNQPNL